MFLFPTKYYVVLSNDANFYYSNTILTGFKALSINTTMYSTCSIEATIIYTDSFDQNN